MMQHVSERGGIGKVRQEWIRGRGSLHRDMLRGFGGSVWTAGRLIATIPTGRKAVYVGLGLRGGRFKRGLHSSRFYWRAASA